MGDRRLTILYGSQTGNAQDIAERIWRESKRFYFTGCVKSMDEYYIPDLINEKCVIFVCSTTGQGEEPDNMKQFWKFMLRKSLQSTALINVKSAVLGLGDSGYAKFNFVAKRLYKRLMQLGADMVLPVGLGDDQHDLGYDAVVDGWIDGLWTKLSELYPLPLGVRPLENNSTIKARWKIDIFDNKLESNEQNYSSIYYNSIKISSEQFLATVIENKRTTSETHFQDVRLIKFATDGSKYSPGDVLYVRPKNSQTKIDEFFSILRSNDVFLNPESTIRVSISNPDMPVPPYLQHDVSLKTLCEQYFDFNAIPRRYVFSVLAQLTNSDLEREKCIEFTTAEGQEELYNYCNRPRRTVLEVLQDFPHAVKNIGIDMLFELFSPIKSRAFSIASSYEAHQGEVHVLVAVVKYKTKLVKERLGLCSNWLANLEIREKVPVWIKKGSFRFPNDKDASIVMVGPGTGVAPFRNYVLESEKFDRSSSDKLLLFFGCRQKESDFHCKEDFLRLHNEKKLNLICAFSRDQDHKIYVQHKIEEMSETIWKLIQSGNVYFYVAGNSKNMPQAVREAFVDIWAKHGNISKDKADNLLESLEKNGRYQTETWA